MRAERKRAAINLVAALLILAVFLQLVGWGDVLAALHAADATFILIGMIVGVTATLVRSGTWFILFPLFGYTYTSFSLLRIYYAGAFANRLTPLGQLGGEPILAYLLSRDADRSYEKFFGSVFTADITNFLPVVSLSIIGLVLFVSAYPSEPVVSSLAAAILTAAAIVLTLLLLVWHKKERMKLVFGKMKDGFVAVFGTIMTALGLWRSERGTNLIDIDSRIEGFYETLQFAFSHRREVMEALIVSHCAKLLEILTVYAFVLALGFDPGLLALLFIVPVANLATLIPVPGGVGSMDVAMAGLLVLIVDIPWPAASAVVLLYRMAVYGVFMVVGGMAAVSLSHDVYWD